MAKFKEFFDVQARISMRKPWRCPMSLRSVRRLGESASKNDWRFLFLPNSVKLVAVTEWWQFRLRRLRRQRCFWRGSDAGVMRELSVDSLSAFQNDKQHKKRNKEQNICGQFGAQFWQLNPMKISPYEVARFHLHFVRSIRELTTFFSWTISSASGHVLEPKERIIEIRHTKWMDFWSTVQLVDQNGFGRLACLWQLTVLQVNFSEKPNRLHRFVSSKAFRLLVTGKFVNHPNRKLRCRMI